MHCELALPALLGSPPRGDPERYRGLELAMARGRCDLHDSEAPEEWLARHFGCGDAPLAAGALTRLAAGRNPGGEGWMRADPVHVAMGESQVSLIPGAACALTPDEASSIVDALNHHFSGELQLEPVEPDRWCVRSDAVGKTETGPAIALSPSALARAREAHRGTRQDVLRNEIEMLLHSHPVNAARAARGAPVLNSLWFWGAGTLPEHVPSPWTSIVANEPVARGLGLRAGIASRALPADAQIWLAALPAEGRHLAFLDALRLPCALGDDEAARIVLEQIETCWVAPLVAALRRGRIGMLSVHLPEAGLSFETTRGDLRRFWRRPRPLSAWVRTDA